MVGYNPPELAAERLQAIVGEYRQQAGLDG
jgi:hypothetical protein